MKKLLKKGHHVVVAQLCSLDVKTSILFSLVDLQNVINNHSKLCRDISKGLPPTLDHDHDIHLQVGSVSQNISPYKYQYAHKSELEHLIQEILEANIIHPNQSVFSSLVVMVTKKEGSWHMCPYYRQLNKITIKVKFLILIID